MNTVVANGNNWKSTVSTMAVNVQVSFILKQKLLVASTNWWVGIIDPSQIQYVSGSKKYTDWVQEVMLLIILLIKVIVVVK